MSGVAALVPYLGGALAVGSVAVGASRRRELIVGWCAWAVGVPVIASPWAARCA